MTTTDNNRAAVRVCAIADAECSRDCGMGACEREREARFPVEQHEEAPAGERISHLEALVQRYRNMVDELKQRLHDVTHPDTPSAPLEGTGTGADERAAFDMSDAEWCDVFERIQKTVPNVFGSYAKVRAEFAREAIRIAAAARASSPNVAGAEGATEADIRKSMTPEQIKLERKLTCEAIDGAMAFGYQNTNPPPSADHWLAPYWHVGRKQAEQEASLSRSPRTEVAGAVAEGWKLVPVEPTEGMKSAALRADDRWRQPGDQLLVQWDAMLAAAPPSPSADAAAAPADAQKTIPKGIFDNLIATLSPAWDYIQTHQDQFDANPGDDKTKILVDEFLHHAYRTAGHADERAASFEDFRDRCEHYRGFKDDTDDTQCTCPGNNHPGSWCEESECPRRARAAASQPAAAIEDLRAIQAVLRDVDPKWRDRGEFGIKARDQIISAVRDLAAAAAGQEAEPFGWAQPRGGNYFTRNKSSADRIGGLIPVYTAPPAQVATRQGLTEALRQAREELSNVEWENDPPTRVIDLFSKIDDLLEGAKR
ncbi:hypothetical protein [Burkholderia sp. AU15512]|uniref:hypothetical protein n=1 Tax=Burkholderia sp. AU15512 TaxID=2015345 RepID=UPI001180B384|nr:hypothetical protein [Burkholderia sp. AU15512]